MGGLDEYALSVDAAPPRHGDSEDGEDYYGGYEAEYGSSEDDGFTDEDDEDEDDDRGGGGGGEREELAAKASGSPVSVGASFSEYEWSDETVGEHARM